MVCDTATADRLSPPRSLALQEATRCPASDHGGVREVGSTRLLGRHAEKERILEEVDRARASRPACVVVAGEAGIGKTRLLTEVCERAAGREDVVLTGHGSPTSEGELPYGVITSALRDLVRREGLDEVRATAPRACEELSHLVPELGSGPVGMTDRARMFDAFSALITTYSRSRVTWLVIEDLQWADSSSLDMLGYLARVVAAPARLLVAGTLRTASGDGEGEARARSFVDQLARTHGVTYVELERLSRDLVAEHLIDLLPDPASPRLLDRVFELGEGVPFLTEELVLAGLSETGPVPATVAALMLSRLSGLSRAAQEFVRACSVGGSDLTHELVGRVCGFRGDSQLQAAAVEAVDAAVLAMTDTDGDYRFRHALLRETVSTSLLPADRRRWHRRWAEALEEALPSDLAASVAAAHHWAQAGDVVRAFDSAYDVAERAHVLGAQHERALLLTRVLRSWDDIPDAAQRAGDRDDLLEEVLSAHIATGQPGAAYDLLEEELHRDAGAEDLVRHCRLLLARAGFAEELGIRTRASLLDDTLRVLAVLEQAPPTRMSARAVAGLVERGRTREEALRYRTIIARAVDVAERIGTPRDRLIVRHAQVMHLEFLGEHQQAAAVRLEQLPSFRSSLPSSETGYWEAGCVWGLSCVGRFAEAVELGRRALAHVPAPQLARYVWVHLAENLGYALFEVGAWEEADDLLERARGMASSGYSRTFVDITRGLIQSHRGKRGDAVASLQSVRREVDSRLPGSPSVVRVWVQWLAATIAVEAGDLPAAQAHLGSLLDMPDLAGSPQGWRIVLLAARTEADRRAQVASRRRRRRLSEEQSARRFEQIRSVARQLTGLADNLREACDAQLAAEQTRFDGHPDPAAWQAAADQWASNGQIHDQAWALVRLAEACLALRDRALATQAVTDAHTLAAALEAAPLITAMAAVARRGRIPTVPGEKKLRQPGSASWAGLTAREVEVLELVAAGHSNNQIAQALVISPKTVGTHVSHILTKLDVPSRAAAAAKAHRRQDVRS